MSLDEGYWAVRDFHAQFGHLIADRPARLAKERVTVRASWLAEEVQEFRDAVDECEQADAMIDIIYFALGGLVELGVKPQKLFEIVHKANMSKLWEDGRPHYGPDGKVIKPIGWRDPGPELAQEILNQSLEA